MNQFIESVVVEAVRQQTWYQRNANTIVAGLVALASLLSLVMTLGLDLPPAAAAGIPAVITFIGTLVTKLIRNGVQLSTAEKLEATPTARAGRPTPHVSAEALVVAAERARSYVGQHRAE